MPDPQTPVIAPGESTPVPNPLGAMFGLFISFVLGIIASLYLNSGDIERVPVLPMIVAAGVPWLGALLLLGSAKAKRVAWGAGIGGGLAIATAITLYFPLLMLSAVESRNVIAATRALLALFVLSIALAYYVLRRWGNRGFAFFGPLVATLIYSFVALMVVPFRM